MAEKVNLVEFDIDVDVLLKNTQDVKQRLDEVKQEMREMTKAGEGSSEAFINNAVTAKSLTREYAAQVKALDRLNNESAETVPLQQQIDTLMRREVTTVAELRKQNSELTKARNQANISTEDGQKQIATINAQLDKNNATIKENVSDLEQQKIGIGGYADGIKEALGGTSLFGGAINDASQVMRQFSPVINLVKEDLNEATTAVRNITAGTEGMTKAKRLATITTNALSASLKLLRVALISTGIGAIVVAFGALVSYLTSTQEGIDRLNRVLTPLKAVFSGLVDVMQQLGKSLVDAFSNPMKSLKALYNFVKDQLVGQFNALGKMLQGLLTVDFNLLREGFTDMTDLVQKQTSALGGYFGSVKDQLQGSYQVGQQIASLTERINASELELRRNRGSLNRQINENREIARDMALSQQERNVAAQKSIELAKELRDMEVGHQEMIIERLQLQQSLSGNTHSDNLEFAEEEAKLDEIQGKHAQDMIRLNSNLNSTRAKGNGDAQKAIDTRIQSLNEEMALWEAQQTFAAKTTEEEIQLAQELADRRVAILDAELDAKKISQTKYDTERLNIQKELAEQQANAVVEAAQRELDNLDDRLGIEAEISNAVGEERLKLEAEQAKKLYDARENFEAIQFMEGLTNKQEYEDNLAEIARERGAREREIERERLDMNRADVAEQRELDLATELAALEERQAAIWEFEEVQIEAQRERDLEQARLKYTDEAMLQQAIANIEQQYQNNRTQLEIEKNKTVFESRLSLLDSLASIFGEQSAIGKAAGIAQATVNAYVGMTEALKLPWPLNLAAAASTLATGLKSVRTISAVDTSIKSPQTKSMRNVASTDSVVATINDIPPFAAGGLVNGGFPIKRSNGDNVLATLKKGEVVLNDEHQMRLGGPSIFRAIGVPGFASGGVAGGSTATLQRSIITGLDETMAKSIGDAVLKGSRQGTQTGSRQGIVDASTERYLDNLATF